MSLYFKLLKGLCIIVYEIIKLFFIQILLELTKKGNG